jgi:hypothetical protein
VWCCWPGAEKQLLLCLLLFTVVARNIVCSLFLFIARNFDFFQRDAGRPSPLLPIFQISDSQLQDPSQPPRCAEPILFIASTASVAMDPPNPSQVAQLQPELADALRENSTLKDKNSILRDENSMLIDRVYLYKTCLMRNVRSESHLVWFFTDSDSRIFPSQHLLIPNVLPPRAKSVSLTRTGLSTITIRAMRPSSTTARRKSHAPTTTSCLRLLFEVSTMFTTTLLLRNPPSKPPEIYRQNREVLRLERWFWLGHKR